jgi:hypothetical protein
LRCSMIRRLWLLVLVGSVGELLSITSAAYAGDAMKQFDIRTVDGEILIATDQILAYEWASHKLTLKPGVRKKLYEKLKGVLATGQTFVVAVGGKKVYEGTWKSVISSSSCATAVIVLDEGVYEPKLLGEDQIRINLGYPSPNFFKGEDPRGNPLIKAALKASGKLKLAPEPKTLDPEAYLNLLQKHGKDKAAYSPGVEGPAVRPVQEQDLPKLIQLLDSQEKCAATMKLGSSFYPEGGSTVGHEAAVLIDSFRLGKPYPIANTSTQHQVDREALLKWWKGLEKKAKQP